MARVGRDRDAGDEFEHGFRHDDPVVDEALEWFGRLREESPDPAVQAEFRAWMQRSSRHEEEFRALEAMWGSVPFARAVASLPADQYSSARRRSARYQSAIGRRTMGIAAAALLLIGVGIWHYPSIRLRWEADYLTAIGEQARIPLPDGSSMVLNSASAVAIDFEGDHRQVRLLEGEAFFDVRHDPDHPFRVAGHFGEVEVKGTAFSVRRGDSEDVVVLERGRVEVARLADPLDHAKLSPGEMVVASSSALSQVTTVDPERVLAWRHGRIIFEDQPMSRVLAELQRYYGGTVIVIDGRVNQLVVTGNYRLDDIEGAIRTLADAAGVTMNRLPGGIIILR